MSPLLEKNVSVFKMVQSIFCQGGLPREDKSGCSVHRWSTCDAWQHIWLGCLLEERRSTCHNDSPPSILACNGIRASASNSERNFIHCHGKINFIRALNSKSLISVCFVKGWKKNVDFFATGSKSKTFKHLIVLWEIVLSFLFCFVFSVSLLLIALSYFMERDRQKIKRCKGKSTQNYLTRWSWSISWLRKRYMWQHEWGT